ncbi:hypothetical protein ALC56_07377 [Trachymyrmex septentrionalis]|uniref:Uncharacterized protein n=1 Tax=Trachymyrmex septentrionalis TaxID=34720 RepID=A0A195FDQ8_9HYME|nr:hypothetical protein ALC56_07377 [Trachymyrmex septentrionalis]
MLLQFHDVLARVRTDVTDSQRRARTKWKLLIMTTGRRRDGLSLLDNLRVFRLVTGIHSRPALITSYPRHGARAVTPGSRRSGRSARREGKLAVETANCGRPLGKRVRGGRGASIRSRERGREKEMAYVYSWLGPCHFSPISRIMCESTDMAGGWIKLLRPPSSTYLPRPSDIELRIPVKATLRQRRFPES